MRGVIAPPAANQHSDALIVGAGPAGSSLAWRLASAGARVLLIDATAFPRSKPCGDALSPGATPFLREMGVVRSLRDAGAHSLRGWRIQAPSGRWFEGRFAAPRTGVPRLAFAVPRSELDSLLLDAALRAGVHFLPSARAFDLVTAEDGRALGVRVRLGDGSARELRARLVVGADGLRSVVARRLGGVRRGNRARLAIVGRFEGTRVDGRLGVMHVSGEGCLGMAPLGGGRCNITVVVPMAAAGRVSTNRWGFYRERLRRYAVWGKVSDGKLSERLQITGPFEVSPRRVVGPGALLVGDAAGYFDPFTGQGIYRALYTAQLAAPRCSAPWSNLPKRAPGSHATKSSCAACSARADGRSAWSMRSSRDPLSSTLPPVSWPPIPGWRTCSSTLQGTGSPRPHYWIRGACGGGRGIEPRGRQPRHSPRVRSVTPSVGRGVEGSHAHV
ncbi:MAG: FAD-dependent monooxygenase [Gemmatimonadetes bacterium]|nr:FAD-dependent monooxygenase [Gemmatimonadota bacterium]